MADYWNMESQDPILDSFAEDIIESGHEELLDNESRGCGHLQRNAAYVRSDLAFASPDGEIPLFVELDDPVEYREYGERGAIIPGYRDFPGVKLGIGYVNDGRTTTPVEEITRHHERLQETTRFDGDHYGAITPARSHDILMSVGATHWPTPGDYIEECQTQGLNLKLPSGPGNEPPVVNPMRTRCWVIHPHGCGDGRAGIIGYAVLTRALYTTGENATAEDPDIPQYAREWHDAGKIDLATPGPETDPESDPEGDEGENEDGPHAGYADLADFEADDQGEGESESEDEN